MAMVALVPVSGFCNIARGLVLAVSGPLLGGIDTFQGKSDKDGSDTKSVDWPAVPFRLALKRRRFRQWERHGPRVKYRTPKSFAVS